MTIARSNTFTTTDGKQFPTHAAAAAHQKYLARAARIEELLVGTGENTEALGDDTTPIAQCLAKLGDALVEALTVPSGRGPAKGSKRTPAAAAA